MRDKKELVNASIMGVSVREVPLERRKKPCLPLGICIVRGGGKKQRCQKIICEISDLNLGFRKGRRGKGEKRTYWPNMGRGCVEWE